MPVRIGNTEVDSVRIGGTEVDAIRVGDDEIYSGELALVSATIFNNPITLTYNRNLDRTRTPSNLCFRASVNGNNRAVERVFVSTRGRVTVQLINGVTRASDVVFVSYLCRTLRTEDGELIPSFTNHRVTNLRASG